MECMGRVGGGWVWRRGGVRSVQNQARRSMPRKANIVDVGFVEYQPRVAAKRRNIGKSSILCFM